MDVLGDAYPEAVIARLSRITKARLEDYLWLRDSGCHIDEIARRMGISSDGIKRMLERVKRIQRTVENAMTDEEQAA